MLAPGYQQLRAWAKAVGFCSSHWHHRIRQAWSHLLLYEASALQPLAGAHRGALWLLLVIC